jgi:hypothetical protein
MCKEECVRGQRRQKEELNQKPENGSGKERGEEAKSKKVALK